jgi:hypothetical protein
LKFIQSLSLFYLLICNALSLLQFTTKLFLSPGQKKPPAGSSAKPHHHHESNNPHSLVGDGGSSSGSHGHHHHHAHAKNGVISGSELVGESAHSRELAAFANLRFDANVYANGFFERKPATEVRIRDRLQSRRRRRGTM